MMHEAAQATPRRSRAMWPGLLHTKLPGSEVTGLVQNGFQSSPPASPSFKEPVLQEQGAQALEPGCRHARRSSGTRTPIKPVPLSTHCSWHGGNSFLQHGLLKVLTGIGGGSKILKDRITPHAYFFRKSVAVDTIGSLSKGTSECASVSQ